MGGKGVADPGADEALDPGHAAPNHEGSPEAQPKAGARVLHLSPLPCGASNVLRAHTQFNPDRMTGFTVVCPVMSGYIHLCRGNKKEVGIVLLLGVHLPNPSRVQFVI